MSAKREDPANLLVTFEQSHAELARKEIESLLGEIGEKPNMLRYEAGLAEIAVGDSRKAIAKLTEICKSDRARFAHTHRWFPVDKWCRYDIKEVQEAVKELAGGITETESWKMELQKRGVKEHTRDLVLRFTEPVTNPRVDLKNPQKIIYVEIIGDRVALSLLKPSELLNVLKV